MATISVKTHRGPVEVEAGQPFATAIKQVATTVGLTAFRVFVNGEELLDESQSPTTIEENMVIGVQPDDIAG